MKNIILLILLSTSTYAQIIKISTDQKRIAIKRKATDQVGQRVIVYKAQKPVAIAKITKVTDKFTLAIILKRNTELSPGLMVKTPIKKKVQPTSPKKNITPLPATTPTRQKHSIHAELFSLANGGFGVIYEYHLNSKLGLGFTYKASEATDGLVTMNATRSALSVFYHLDMASRSGWITKFDLGQVSAEIQVQGNDSFLGFNSDLNGLYGSALLGYQFFISKNLSMYLAGGFTYYGLDDTVTNEGENAAFSPSVQIPLSGVLLDLELALTLSF